MEPGGQYSTPLVRGGTMFLAHPGDVIQALDATSGDLIWEFRWDDRLATPDSERRRAARPRARSIRNIAILGDRLFHFTADRHLIALNARTGALAWSIEEAGAGIGHMAGPMIADGKIVSGRSCAATGGPDICYIAAHAPEDGREIWRVRTIPRPGEPGDETWGGLPYERRVHVGAWGFGSYDPSLNLVYWGTSVPAPSLERLRGTVGQDVLFSNSTLAIDARTGHVVWHYQHLPRDNWDLDHVFERILVDAAVSPDPEQVRWINPRLKRGEMRQVVTGIPGKTGIVYTLDRKTGEFLWARETIHQNVVKDIDPAVGSRVNRRQPRGRRLRREAGVPIARRRQRLASRRLLSAHAADVPAATEHVHAPDGQHRSADARRRVRDELGDGGRSARHAPDDRPHRRDFGRDRPHRLGARAARRDHRQRARGRRAAWCSAATWRGASWRSTTRAATVLWETVLSGPVSGHAISYAVNGRQYIAIPAGGDTASPEKRVLSLHPEIKPPQGQNAIFVFALSPSAERRTTAGAVPWGVAGLAAGLLAGIAVTRRRRRGGDAAGAAAAPRRDGPTIESKESQ